MSSPGESDDSPYCYLIVYNVSKKHNIGTIARCATAFNVKQVCLVGSRQFNTFGSHGADNHVDICHYNRIEECCKDLRESKGCEIVGIEIVDEAKPVQSFPFKGNTAFMLGNEYGPGTASLNVAVAASIVLHNFALWAGYQERARQGQKFIVQQRPERTRPRGYIPLTEAEAAAERLRRQQALESDSADEGLSVFD